MLFDRNLAEAICKEMNIPFGQEPGVVTLAGQPLPSDFQVSDLFLDAFDYTESISQIQLEPLEGYSQCDPVAFDLSQGKQFSIAA